MPRRKQDCPKRMKWEGGEDEPPREGDKMEGDDSDSMSPTSAASPAPPGDESGSLSLAALQSPRSPHSITDEPSNHLTERELTSPRCYSRESAASSIPRCPSAETDLRNVPTPATMSPVGVALPPTLPAAAAAALLPPQSAAMAVYLNAAAAVAQHSHRLIMGSPLPPYSRGSISPLISSTSPTSGGYLNASGTSPSSVPLQSPLGGSAILDYSKRSQIKSEPAENDSDVMNLTKSETPPSDPPLNNSPLDLSITNRKRNSDDIESQPPLRKSRPSEYKSPLLSQWPTAPHIPYLAAAVAAATSPKSGSSSDSWNGKLKYGGSTPSDATKALEKMSELSKLGGEDLFRTLANSGASANSSTSRHSAWQSHWLNKGAEQAKDVLKCVWCKQSFPSLAAMTTHMKEAKHCGVSVPVPPMQSQNIPPSQLPTSSSSSIHTNSGVSSSNSGKPNQSELNLLIKETMPLPRKLVRGQDVWLGKGAEQTRQILKCMWCGQSFRSLAEMTSHMQQTQHYTNIISQEQIISWKSADDLKGGGGGNTNSSTGSAVGANSHVSAVLTCKVCDQAFTSLKELSNHMVKNSHYKEHIMRSITDGGRRRQTREKRKKSLPVRKLLELERAQHEFKNGDTGSIIGKSTRDLMGAGRITCEKCGDKIDTSIFVDHIRQCVGGGTIGSQQRNFLKNALISNHIIPPDNALTVHTSHRENSINKKESPSPVSQQRSSSATDLSSGKDSAASDGQTGTSPSVLNAIEKLIEKSFDSRARQNAYTSQGPTAPMGSSILKRLGIDESVDYTKPLVDAQTMNLLRNYQHQQAQHHHSRRERSGSESSSISERGSSRVDALTPERKMETPHHHISSTPRSTPDKRDKSPTSEIMATDIEIKKEDDEYPHEHHEVNFKREPTDEGDDDDRSSFHSNGAILPTRMSTESRDDDAENAKKSPSRHSPGESPRRAIDAAHVNSPCRNSTSSPASSDRSGTPRSTNGDKKGCGSLGALSSMFDNLSGTSPGENPAPGRRTSSHPLAALQKLCDKTETHHTNNRNNAPSTTTSSINSSSASTTSSGTTPGAILAFSWACNDAMMTSDSIMKCAFCDTPFISKGAYRHHLSKMHFVKDGVIPDPVALKSSQPSSSGGSAINLKASGASASAGSRSVENKSPPAASSFEESPHSKFLKYTELAKQLSSKYV